MPLYQTVITWNPLLDPVPSAEVEAEAARRYEQGLCTQPLGKTAPNHGGIANNVAPMQTFRTWTSREAADDWASYVSVYGPVKIEIEAQ